MVSTADQPEFDAKSFLANLTQQPGVYQMYDRSGTILYVGKAKNLKARVSSYFRQSGLSIKTEALVKKIQHIDVTITGSEAQALVLEQNLIKAQKPPYNILLRDDKSYPYIYLSSNDDYPRLALHRGPKKGKGQYFGPFPNASAVRDSLQFLQKTFKVRQCEDSVFSNRSRPCLQYQIGRCTAPCVDLVSTDEYAEDVRHTAMFLEGKNESLHNELAASMELAADQLDFEKAAVYRDQISALRQVQAHSNVESGTRDVDVIACAQEAGEVCVHVLYVRQGRMLGSKSYFHKNKLGGNEAQFLEEFLPQFYLGGRTLNTPSEIVISHPVEGQEAIVEAIREAVGRTVELNDNVRTHRASWLAMAMQAAAQNLRARLSGQQAIIQKYEALQNILAMDELPKRLECFDISHSSGERPVASCVVFDHGGAVKSDYRRFNIDGIKAGDDYAAIEQALTRRYSRLQKEGRPLPSILIVDGGKGQLNKAREVVAELAITGMMLLGIAKGTTRKPGFETLILESGKEMVLASDHPALHLLQQIRDEAHRFAITGHKQARDKQRRKSRLEDVPGVGPKRRKQLIQHFGGLQELTRASIEDITKVPGMSKKLAQEVYSTLHCE